MTPLTFALTWLGLAVLIGGGHEMWLRHQRHRNVISFEREAAKRRRHPSNVVPIQRKNGARVIRINSNGGQAS